MAIASDRLLRALLPPAVAVVRPLVFLLGRTWRTRWVAGEEHLDRLAAAGRPAVYALWHQGILSVSLPSVVRQAARGVPLAGLVSRSRDGELVVRVARPLPVELVRGSTAHGGVAGLRTLIRLVKRRGVSVVTAADGPRGPARVAKPGTAVLARSAGAPIVPLAAAVDRSWRFRSWDRLVVPKPFARVALAAGEPWEVSETADPQEESERLGEILDELEAECGKALGLSPSAGGPPAPPRGSPAGGS